MSKVRPLSAAISVVLSLVLAGSVMAQTPEPIERTPEMEQHAGELAALFPESLAGVSLLENLQVEVGQELLAELDPSDPDEARDIEQLHELATTVGATLDDAAVASSYAQLTEDTWAYVIAFQVRGSDVQPALPLLVAAFQEDAPDALVEEGQVGDESVTVMRSGDDPEDGAFVFLARGDVIWLVSVPPDQLEEAIGSLPQP